MFYSIYKVDSEGEAEHLDDYKSYKEADLEYNNFAEKYPDDVIEIVDRYGDFYPPQRD